MYVYLSVYRPTSRFSSSMRDKRSPDTFSVCTEIPRHKMKQARPSSMVENLETAGSSNAAPRYYSENDIKQSNRTSSVPMNISKLGKLLNPPREKANGKLPPKRNTKVVCDGEKISIQIDDEFISMIPDNASNSCTIFANAGASVDEPLPPAKLSRSMPLPKKSTKIDIPKCMTENYLAQVIENPVAGTFDESLIADNAKE